MKGMTVLFACAAFASCSHDLSIDETAVVENLKNEYRANFVQKYGEIDPNQSWDFTNLSAKTATRAADHGVLWKGSNGQTTWEAWSLNNGFWSFIDIDAPGVKAAVADALEKDWDHALAVELYPCYAHGKGVDKDQYFHLAIVEKGKEYENKTTVINKIDCIGNIKTKDDSWYGAGGALIHNSGRMINAKNILSDNRIWVAYYTWVSNTYGTTPYKENKEILKTISTFEIKKYKEIKVNDHTYWCFDCNKDGDYHDLICLVKNADPVKVEKRYLIEDLGSSSDFDFNDIVVDVIQNSDGTQKAKIRAMGGTLNFTLQIGDATATWTKGGSEITVDLNGTKEVAEITKMYNTVNPIYELVLAEFTVSGWRPADNNIKVFVTKGNDVTKSGDVIIEIPFSRTGEVPMIIAVDPLTYWNKEWVELRRDWWEYPAIQVPEDTDD